MRRNPDTDQNTERIAGENISVKEEPRTVTQDIRPLQILAGLYYHDGIHKHDLQEKLFGVFPHMVARRSSMFMRGFDDTFMVPHSRHTTIRREEV